MVTDPGASFPVVTAPDSLNQLHDGELAAIRSAAVWYAKYRARTVAELVGDDSAYATTEREEYLDLISGLAKLGVRIRIPDALVDADSRAA